MVAERHFLVKMLTADTAKEEFEELDSQLDKVVEDFKLVKLLDAEAKTTELYRVHLEVITCCCTPVATCYAH